MHMATPRSTSATTLNTKLLPPPVGRTHRYLIASASKLDLINSDPTSTCQSWGVRLKVDLQRVMKRDVYRSVLVVLVIMVVSLLDLIALCAAVCFFLYWEAQIGTLNCRGSPRIWCTSHVGIPCDRGASAPTWLFYYLTITGA